MKLTWINSILVLASICIFIYSFLEYNKYQDRVQHVYTKMDNRTQLLSNSLKNHYNLMGESAMLKDTNFDIDKKYKYIDYFPQEYVSRLQLLDSINRHLSSYYSFYDSCALDKYTIMCDPLSKEVFLGSYSKPFYSIEKQELFIDNKKVSINKKHATYVLPKSPTISLKLKKYVLSRDLQSIDSTSISREIRI